MNGIVTIASGERYWDMAVMLAHSARRFDIPTVVITTDKETPAKHPFSRIVHVDDSVCVNQHAPERCWELKSLLYSLVPEFERCAFVDADSLVIRDPEPMFELCDEHSIVTPGARQARAEERWAVPRKVPLDANDVGYKVNSALDRNNEPPSESRATQLQTLNGGFLLWERGETAERWFAELRRIFEQVAKLYQGYGVDRIRDELCISIAFNRFGINLPPCDASIGVWDASNLVLNIQEQLFEATKHNYWGGHRFKPYIAHFGHGGSRLHRKTVWEVAQICNVECPDSLKPEYKDIAVQVKPNAYSISKTEHAYLEQFVAAHKFKNVLEIGPGYSTDAFLRASARVTSLETDHRWYEAARRQYPQADIQHTPNLDEVETPECDFAFIDGPAGNLCEQSRLDACRLAARVSKRWMLHDADRKDEQAILDEFESEGWVRRSVPGFPKLVEMIHPDLLPKICLVCVTYNRPNQLPEAIESFLRQDYPEHLKEMVILDDAGQYESQEGEGWRLISIPHRFRTMGEKRNAAHALASPDVEAYGVLDDDDILLPHHLKNLAFCFLDGAEWARPSGVLIDKTNELQIKKPGGYLFSTCGGFTREIFERVSGYPMIQTGQDQGLASRFAKAKAREARMSGEPSYIYRFYSYPNPRHLSAAGKEGYERRGEESIPRIEGAVKPHWSKDWTKGATA
jgi:hypothetical protein